MRNVFMGAGVDFCLKTNNSRTNKTQKEWDMEIETSRNDLILLQMILNKELGETRVEIRHGTNRDYKNCLKEREKQIKDFLTQIENKLGTVRESERSICNS